jgi:alpha-glucoside transport system substrate-binding protein
MYFLGAFTQGFIEAQFPDLEPEEDYDFFKFPAIDPEYQGRSPAERTSRHVQRHASARSLMNYLADGANPGSRGRVLAATLSPSRALDMSAYPDPLAAKAAQQLTESEIFRFGAGDLMPPEVQSAFWNGSDRLPAAAG